MGDLLRQRAGAVLQLSVDGQHIVFFIKSPAQRSQLLFDILFIGRLVLQQPEQQVLQLQLRTKVLLLPGNAGECFVQGGQPGGSIRICKAVFLLCGEQKYICLFLTDTHIQHTPGQGIQSISRFQKHKGTVLQPHKKSIRAAGGDQSRIPGRKPLAGQRRSIGGKEQHRVFQHIRNKRGNVVGAAAFRQLFCRDKTLFVRRISSRSSCWTISKRREA